MESRIWLALGITAILLGATFAPRAAEACGGVTATIADDPKPFGVRTASGPRGVTLHYDRAGNVYVSVGDIRISSALAEAIATRYLNERYGRWSHLEFEGFTYDHGDLVYMYHAHVPNLAASVHVGPLNFATEHAHVHVSATAGDVYGFGCGLGSGIVEMPFEPSAYPADLKTKRLPYVQFDTAFVAREGQGPRIDGWIDPDEWKDAGGEVIHVGTARPTVTEYG
ncbi:MAG: hypothetical protein HY724_11915 [Candidatus Rokubacteria bacterium]|nr:hypothetical protein [Candidatus Rokubacteria bacterium]